MTAIAQEPRAPLARRLALPDLSHQAFNVWRRNRDVHLKLWKTELFLPLIEPILVLLGMGLGLGGMVQLDGHTSYVRFLSPGVLAQFPMFMATFECAWGAYFRMESQGVYMAISSTPASLDDVVAGELIWAATRCTITTLYILLVLLAFTPTYGIVRSPYVLLSLPVAFLMGLVFGGLSLCFTARAPAISFLGYFFTLVVIPLFWLSGTFFPLERMPGWIQHVAEVLPLTQTTSTYRHLLNGAPQWADIIHVLCLGAEAALLGCVAMALVRLRLIK